jgi:hypothetical protein
MGVSTFWTEKKSWAAFYAEIVAFCQRNNRPVPSDEDVQNFICKQLTGGWCYETGAFNPVEIGYQECTTCGGR